MAEVEHKLPATDFFWDLAEPLLGEESVDEGTLMGFPCVRVNGEFFCTCDHRTGHLIVKIHRDRVEELITAGVGESFAPAGRVFKEWMLVEKRNEETWIDLMEEAKAFVARSSEKKRASKRKGGTK